MIKASKLSAINYFLITPPKKTTFLDFISAPTNLTPKVCNLISDLPVDWRQILNVELYAWTAINEFEKQPLGLKTIDLGHFIRAWRGQQTPHIKVFILSQLNDKEIMAVLSKLQCYENYYYTIVDTSFGTTLKKQSNKNYFTDSLSLIKKIRRDEKKIYALFERSLSEPDRSNLRADYSKYTKTEFLIPPLFPVPIFKAAHPSFLILNQINGNFWRHGYSVNTHTQHDLKEARLDACTNIYDHGYKRAKIILKMVREIDKEITKRKIPVLASDIEATFAPLICVLPSQNPQVPKLCEVFGYKVKKEYLSLFKLEQNSNYTFYFNGSADRAGITDFEQDTMEFIHNIAQKRLMYFDALAFLNASFTFSPIIRFPMVGRSIFKELSFLRPGQGESISMSKLDRTIDLLASKLNELIMYPELEDYLQRRNGQIVAISDIPIEFVKVNGLPLQLTHDVCRIPETNSSAGVTSFGMNREYAFKIPKDIMDKTLVILGAEKDDEHFLRSNAFSKAFLVEFNTNIKVGRCISSDQVIEAINDFKPSLLIMDCHGDYDEKTFSTHLMINGEIFSHKHVAMLKHPIPLVFLSACMTSPTYGYVNSIANAFLQGGSLSVSTTVLPISISKGTTLYMRLLIHLEKIAKNGDFPNWLAFVSHIARSSAFSDVVFKICEQEQQGKISSEKSAEILEKLEGIIDSTITFDKRRATFEKIEKLIANLETKKKINFKDMAKENLLYSHIGRSDLIFFESWVERKKQKIRDLSQDTQLGK
jgi:hypothetical protein